MVYAYFRCAVHIPIHLCFEMCRQSMCYLAPASHGCIRTPFHYDAFGAQLSHHAVIFGDKHSFNSVLTYPGDRTDTEESTLRSNIHMRQVGNEELPHCLKVKFESQLSNNNIHRDDGDDGVDEYVDADGALVQLLRPGSVMIIPIGSIHAFGKYHSLLHRITRLTSPICGLAGDTAYIGLTAVSIAANIAAIMIASKTNRIYTRSGMCFVESGILAIGALILALVKEQEGEENECYDSQSNDADASESGEARKEAPIVSKAHAQGIWTALQAYVKLDKRCAHVVARAFSSSSSRSSSSSSPSPADASSSSTLIGNMDTADVGPTYARDWTCTTCRGEISNTYAYSIDTPVARPKQNRKSHISNKTTIAAAAAAADDDGDDVAQFVCVHCIVGEDGTDRPALANAIGFRAKFSIGRRFYDAHMLDEMMRAVDKYRQSEAQ